MKRFMIIVFSVMAVICVYVTIVGCITLPSEASEYDKSRVLPSGFGYVKDDSDSIMYDLGYSKLTGEVISIYRSGGTTTGVYNVHYKNYVLYYDDAEDAFYYYDHNDVKTDLSREELAVARGQE